MSYCSSSRPDGRAPPLPIHSSILAALAALLSRGPLRLTDLPCDARDAVGRAIDQGAVRLVLDDDGSVVAMRDARA